MRLVDQFVAELREHRGSMPFEIELTGIGPGLIWPLPPDVETIGFGDDRPFKVTGYTRLVSIGLVVGEIRFHASRIETDMPVWQTAALAERLAAVEADSDDTESATFENVRDAVAFTIAYLSGTPLGEINIPRTPRIEPTY